MTKKFNFDEAVAQARRDYPEETKNIVFIDANHPDAGDQMKRFFQEISPAAAAWMLETNDEGEQDILMMEMLNEGCYGLRDPESGKGVLVYNDITYLSESIIAREALKHLSFQHELGHLVVGGGHFADSMKINGLQARNPDHQRDIKRILDDEEPFRENIADSFAALEGLRQQTLSPHDIKRLGTLRAKDAVIHRDASHLTMLALHTISLSAESGDFLSLTPATVKKIAQEHAARFTPSPDDMRDITASKFRADKLTTAMGRALSESTAGSHAEQVLSHVLEDALQKDSKIHQTERQRLQALLDTRKKQP